jgi:hypothetical protein
MAAGLTMLSKSAALTYPVASAVWRSVVLSSPAWRAMAGAFHSR